MRLNFYIYNSTCYNAYVQVFNTFQCSYITESIYKMLLFNLFNVFHSLFPIYSQQRGPKGNIHLIPKLREMGESSSSRSAKVQVTK